jgi:hypothetical protein
MAGIHIMESPDWKQLDQCCKHNANIHYDDKSKYLKQTREGAAAKPSVGASSGSVAGEGQSRRVCKSLLTPGGSGRR